MNRKKTINELVRVLADEYTSENIYPEHELGKKEKPCLVVTAASEEAHESIVCASELSIELVVEINDEDQGGVDMDALTAFVITPAFKASLTAGGIVTVHRVEVEGSEIERENTTTKQTLSLRLWVYGG